MTICYLAEPIDQAHGGVGSKLHGLLALTELHLFNLGWAVFHPRLGWEVPPKATPDPRVQEVNWRALELADAVVAYLPAGVPSIGVPMEVEAACQRGIPVLVITDVNSYALAGRDGVTVADRIETVHTWADRVLHSHTTRQPTQPTLRLVMCPDADHAADNRGYADDAGIDLVTRDPVTIPPGRAVDVATTIGGVQLPPDTWGMITGRSSTLRKLGLHIPVSVIDPGWRGPLFVCAHNLTDRKVTVQPGQRIGQLVLLHNRTAQVQIHAVEPGMLDPHPRGTNGFGSTGA